MADGGLTRVYGWFKCNLCHRHWESSKVYVITGTDQAKYGQRCRDCPEGWTKPYKVEPLKCKTCGCSPCECRCDDCGNLTKRRRGNVRKTHNFWEDEFDDESDLDSDSESFADIDSDLCSDDDSDEEDYCRCGLGSSDVRNIDPRKPHLASLCEKCKSGNLCDKAIW